MQTLITAQEAYHTLAAPLAAGGGNGTGQNLANGIRDFVGPILLVLISIMAIQHLFGENKSAAKLLGYVISAIAVCLIFYSPGIIKGIAGDIKDWF